IGEIKRDLAPLQFKELDTNPVAIPEFSRTLYSLSGYSGMATNAIGTNEPALTQQFVELRKTIERLRRNLLAGSPSDIAARAEKLAQFQQALFNDLRETFNSLKNQ